LKLTAKPSNHHHHIRSPAVKPGSRHVNGF
jgi:hypothetical protein